MQNTSNFQSVLERHVFCHQLEEGVSCSLHFSPAMIPLGSLQYQEQHDVY
jgi:hypothetical protein